MDGQTCGRVDFRLYWAGISAFPQSLSLFKFLLYLPDLQSSKLLCVPHHMTLAGKPNRTQKKQ